MARERRRQVLGLHAGVGVADRGRQQSSGATVGRRRSAPRSRSRPAPPASLRICALIPIARPRASSNGPPELPWAIGASIWIASISWKFGAVSAAIERPTAETTPTASESTLPSGLPIAATGSPTTTAAEPAERQRRERMRRRVDPDHADVVEDVPADDRRGTRSWSANST